MSFFRKKKGEQEKSKAPSSSSSKPPAAASSSSSSKPSSSRRPSISGPLPMPVFKTPASSTRPSSSRPPLSSRPPPAATSSKLPGSSKQSSSAGPSTSELLGPATQLHRDFRELKSVVSMAPPTISKTSIFVKPEDKKMAEKQLNYKSLAPEEKKKQDKWLKERVFDTNVPCPGGYAWERISSTRKQKADGFICNGGQHLVTDDMIAEGKRGLWILPDGIGTDGSHDNNSVFNLMGGNPYDPYGRRASGPSPPTKSELIRKFGPRGDTGTRVGPYYPFKGTWIFCGKFQDYLLWQAKTGIPIDAMLDYERFTPGTEEMVFEKFRSENGFRDPEMGKAPGGPAR